MGIKPTSRYFPLGGFIYKLEVICVSSQDDESSGSGLYDFVNVGVPLICWEHLKYHNKRLSSLVHGDFFWWSMAVLRRSAPPLPPKAPAPNPCSGRERGLDKKICAPCQFRERHWERRSWSEFLTFRSDRGANAPDRFWALKIHSGRESVDAESDLGRKKPQMRIFFPTYKKK